MCRIWILFYMPVQSVTKLLSPVSEETVAVSDSCTRYRGSLGQEGMACGQPLAAMDS